MIFNIIIQIYNSPIWNIILNNNPKKLDINCKTFAYIFLLCLNFNF